MKWIQFAVLLSMAAPLVCRANDAMTEWSEIQLRADKSERKQWWLAVGASDLEPFLAAGVDVSLVDSRGWSALHSAARYSTDPGVIGALLEAGAEVTVADRSGGTPLHWAAAENANPDVTEVLLNAGADVNARDHFGWLPLHAAAESNPSPEVIKLLLEAGSNQHKRAYFVLFKPKFLLKHNKKMSEEDRNTALAMLEK